MHWKLTCLISQQYLLQLTLWISVRPWGKSRFEPSPLCYLLFVWSPCSRTKDHLCTYICVKGVYTSLALFWCDSLTAMFALVDSFPLTSYKGYLQAPGFWLQTTYSFFHVTEPQKIELIKFSAMTHMWVSLLWV